MVHLDKVEGQRGSMVLQDDGSIVSSTGSLSSSEHTASTLMSLLSHSLRVDFNDQQQNGQGAASDNGNNSAGEGAQLPKSAAVTKWNRVTVSFGDHSYIACLSNKKIHVVDRDSTTTSASTTTNGAAPTEDTDKNLLAL